VTQVVRNQPDFEPSVKIADIEVPETNGTPVTLPGMAESIDEIGPLHPITITPKNGSEPTKSWTIKYKLVAGRARLEAAKQKGWTDIPAMVVYGDPAVLASIAAQENLVRRNLTCLEEAILLSKWQIAYEQKCPETKKGGDVSKKEQNDNLAFCQYASQRTVHKERTIQRLVRIAKGLHPKAVEVLRGTRMADRQSSLDMLVTNFKDNKKLQKSAVLKAHGNPRELQLAIEEVRREELKAKPCNWASDNVKLVDGDFKDEGKKIPDLSVDLVLTDVPWKKEFVGLGDHLGKFAHRVLKPGGSLVMMLGQATQLPFLELVRNHIADDAYDWWQLAYVYKNGTATPVYYLNIASKWRPIWAAIKKGGKSHHFISDLIKETEGVIASGGKDKTYHEWGQSADGFEKLVEYLTKPGDLVVDPCVGGGGTAVAAYRLKRRFIGIDIDKGSIHMTRLHLQGEADSEKAKMKNLSVPKLASHLLMGDVSVANGAQQKHHEVGKNQDVSAEPKNVSASISGTDTGEKKVEAAI
jgi:hypothetical protein